MITLLFTAALLAQTPQSPTEQVPLAPAEPTAVVVAIQSDPVLVERLSLVKSWNSAVGVSVLSTREFLRRLTGMDSPKVIDPNVTRQQLEVAEDYQAGFDIKEIKAAVEMREEVVQDFDSSVIPNLELATLAVRALHSAAAAAVYAGKMTDARIYAHQAVSRFPHVPFDTTYYRLDVGKVFKQAARDMQRTPLTQVTFTSTMPGHVFVNGRDLGLASPQLVVKLQPQHITVWVASETATSLAHAFDVGFHPLDVTIDVGLEGMLAFQPIPTLRCAPTCDTALRHLAQAVRVDQAIGLELVDNAEVARGLYVKADDGTAATRVIAALAAPERLLVSDSFAAAQSPQLYLQPPPTKPFSPMLFVPFGGAQIWKKRYVTGAIYAGVQVGLAAWSISTAASNHDEDVEHARSIREQHNLATGLLLGAMAANIIEALIVHAMSD